MPYKVIGNKVYHKKGGKWSVKQTCKSHSNAMAAMRLLRGVEGGEWKPRKKAEGKNYIRG